MIIIKILSIISLTQKTRSFSLGENSFATSFRSKSHYLVTINKGIMRTCTTALHLIFLEQVERTLDQFKPHKITNISDLEPKDREVVGVAHSRKYVSRTET